MKGTIMKKIFFIILLFNVFVSLGYADEQETEYIYSNEEVREKYKDMVGFVYGSTLAETPYAIESCEFKINLAIHIVTDEDGNYGVNDSDLQSGLQILTDALDHINISYDIILQETIKNDDYVQTTLEEEEALAAQYNLPDAVNIYFVYGAQNKGLATFSPVQQAWYNAVHAENQRRYEQYIIIENAYAGTSTLAHEMGHFFDLFHTFERVFDSNEITNPYERNDLIADTPELGGDGFYDCNSNIEEEWQLAHNLMSGDSGCRERFTGEQGAKMRYALVNRRPELIQSKIPIKFTNKINNDNAGGQLKVTQDGNTYIVNSGNEVQLRTSIQALAQTENERFKNYNDSGKNFKHHDWNGDVSFFKLKKYFEPLPDNDQDANFIEINSIYLKTKLTGMVSNLSGQIYFHDPWYVDENNNQPDDFLPFSTPYFPTGNANETSGGVFLDQSPDPNDPNKPYYSVKAEEQQTFKAHDEDVTGYFLGWEGTNVDFQHPDQLETPVVFHAANA